MTQRFAWCDNFFNRRCRQETSQRHFCCWFVFLASIVGADHRGPTLVTEPPYRIEFSNGSGARLECAADGSPQPQVTWHAADGTKVTNLTGVREVRDGGAVLVFPPFPADAYRQDAHTTIYRCRAENDVGVVVSRDVHVRAVLKQKYEVDVYDEHVISDNTAVLRCRVPTYVQEYIIVTSWVQDSTIDIYPSTSYTGSSGKYALIPHSGDLLVQSVGPADGYRSYACRTLHKLTKETRVSTTRGRLVVQEPKGSEPPRLSLPKRSTRHVRVGDDLMLPCAGQGNPPPSYTWYKEEDDSRDDSYHLPFPSNGSKSQHSSGATPLRPGASFASSQLRHSTGGVLRLSKVRLEDAGKYVCRVNNSVGEESLEVRLIVTAPLSAHVQPAVQVADVGKSAVFRCLPSGHPVSKLVWVKDGRPLSTSQNAVTGNNKLTADRRYQIYPSDTLKIQRVEKEDAGMFQCFVSNEWDMAQSAAQLRLGDASPELSYKFSEQTLQPGPSVSLKCTAVGNPPPHFVWTLDGFPLPDNERFLVGQYVTIHDSVISHVNITNVREEDGGEYSCTARNSAGSVMHSGRVNVYGLPLVRKMPRVQAVAGRDLRMKCPVSGFPIESITWEKSGVALPKNRRQRVYANGTLVIEQVQKGTDGGSYSCHAKNRQGYSASGDVQVDVIVSPKIVPFQFMNHLLREGMRAAISCQVLEGDRPITFTWARNGHPLSLGMYSTTSDGISVKSMDEYSHQLSIEKINSSHNGDYTCIAENVAGRETFTAQLTVNVPPKWTVEPKDSSATFGDDLTLNCQAEGYPMPTVTWRKATGNQPGDYKEFTYDLHVEFYSNGSLLFRDVSKETEGHYLCEARNGVGTGVSKVIFVRVNAPPRFGQKSTHVEVRKGDRCQLQCAANGDTPMEIIWKSATGATIHADGMPDRRYTIREQPIQGGLLSELSIFPTDRHDTASFVCHAANAYGRDQMSVQLTIQEIPEQPKNVRVTEQTSQTVQLAWSDPYNGNTPILNYMIQYKPAADMWQSGVPELSVPGTQNMASIAGLRPASAYHFRLIAQNKMGFSEPSEIIQVTTDEDVPSGPPEEVRVDAQSSVSLLVRWEPPHRDSWNGNLLGYYVGYKEAIISSSGTSTTSNSSQHHRRVRPGSSSSSSSSSSGGYQFRTVPVGSQYGGEVALVGLKMFTRYLVVVQAYNSRGAGPMSMPISASTLEDVPSSPPEDVRCEGTTSQSIRVSWRDPPAEGRNGVLQGFKVTHLAAEDRFDRKEAETKVTAARSTSIHGLQKFTNYSIAVLSFTAAGDGIASPPVFCRTDEDVPSAPEAIKVLLSGKNALLVAWKVPVHANGELDKYTLYMRKAESGKKGEEQTRTTLPSKATWHEINGLSESARYEFWVTASTRVGEGESTKLAAASPASVIPARIASFSSELSVPWKENVSLGCRKVGIPEPRTAWRHNGRPLEPADSRRRMSAGGALIIRDIQQSDEGNYTCHVYNSHGEDHITYVVSVQVPPDPPELSVQSSYKDSLRLKWISKQRKSSVALSGNASAAPVWGYIVNYKRELGGDWEELQIESGSEGGHLLRGLRCATRYQLYVTAYNRIGTGLPSDIVAARTKGGAPMAPSSSQTIVDSNSTAASVRLDSWSDGGCDISSFTVEWREPPSTEWMLLSANLSPQLSIYQLPSTLTPSTRYEVKVTARNHAGHASGTYDFTTPSVDIGTANFPAIIRPDSTDGILKGNNNGLELDTASSESSGYMNAKVVVPAVLAFVALLGSAAVALFFHMRKRNQKSTFVRQPSRQSRRSSGHQQQMGESPSTAQLQNQQNRDQQYSVVPVQSRARSASSGGRAGERGGENIRSDAVIKSQSTEYLEDICPYATFQLPSIKSPYGGGGVGTGGDASVLMYSGNIYSGPYHSVQGASFVYHDTAKTTSGGATTSSAGGADRLDYKLRHGKEPEYTKVIRRPRMRDPHSAESQESDNLGSTDSEVKKILTLHLPISEYDTLGSDSAEEVISGSGSKGGASIVGRQTPGSVSSGRHYMPQPAQHHAGGHRGHHEMVTFRQRLGRDDVEVDWPLDTSGGCEDMLGEENGSATLPVHLIHSAPLPNNPLTLSSSPSSSYYSSSSASRQFNYPTQGELAIRRYSQPYHHGADVADMRALLEQLMQREESALQRSSSGRSSSTSPSSSTSSSPTAACRKSFPPHARPSPGSKSSASGGHHHHHHHKAGGRSSDASSKAGHVIGKRQVRSSSGYSSHTEETTFSFADAARIQPPSRFSDSHSRELSEAECDMSAGSGVPYRKGSGGPPIGGAKHRKGSSSSAPGSRSGSSGNVHRESREAFQINV